MMVLLVRISQFGSKFMGQKDGGAQLCNGTIEELAGVQIVRRTVFK
jgi:hypothetical protein